MAEDLSEANRAYENAEYDKAAQLFLPFAKKENVTAQLKLASIYIWHSAGSTRVQEGIDILKKLADQNNKEAASRLASTYNFIVRGQKEAAFWYERAAEMGDPEAQYEIGSRYRFGREGVEVNQKKAMSWITTAAENGNRLAQLSLVSAYVDGYLFPVSDQKSFEWLKRLAGSGDSQSLFCMGIRYDTGWGVPQNSKLALDYFKKTYKADSGSILGRGVPAMVVGAMYAIGRGAHKDTQQAEYWYALADRPDIKDKPREVFAWVSLYLTLECHATKTDRQQVELVWIKLAAEHGNESAQNKLADYYFKKDSPERNIYKALELYTASAEQGYSYSQRTLADLYYDGVEFTKDIKKANYWYEKFRQQADLRDLVSYGDKFFDEKDYFRAERWYRAAADSGSPYAKYMVGMLYTVGGSKSNTVALDWYRKAAADNFPGAKFSLGEFYLAGRGVPKNEHIAFEWYLKAAQQNHMSAQKKIVDMYALGIGIPKDKLKAYFWLLLANAHDDAKLTDKLSELEKDLSAAERIRTQNDASNWTPLPKPTDKQNFGGF